MIVVRNSAMEHALNSLIVCVILGKERTNLDWTTSVLGIYNCWSPISLGIYILIFAGPRCVQRGPDYKLNWTIYVCMYVALWQCMIIGRHKNCCLVIGYNFSNITRLIRNHGRFLYIRKAFKTLEKL